MDLRSPQAIKLTVVGAGLGKGRWGEGDRNSRFEYIVQIQLYRTQLDF